MRQPTITVGLKKFDEKAHSVLFWASEKTLQMESVQELMQRQAPMYMKRLWR